MTLPLAQAFLEQAKTDYSTFETIRKIADQPPSQWLHLLQMVLEKTAKAYLAAGNNEDYETLRRSHRAFRRFTHTLPRNQGVRDSFNMNPHQLRQHIKNLETLIDEIEHLVPGQDNQGVTAEYPWPNPRGGFYTPCQYGYENIVSVLNNTARGRNLLVILTRGLTDERWHIAFGITSPH